MCPENGASDDNNTTQSSDYIITGKAQCATDKHVASSISQNSTTALVPKNAEIYKPSPKPLNCCADYGTTEQFLSDKAAFLSYHLARVSIISLGNGTRLEQNTIGTAQVKLNGKIILLQNILQVPSLQEPLYSL